MTGRERVARLRALVAAAGAGWLAAMAATLPISLRKVWTESIAAANGGAPTESAGVWGTLLWSLGAGAAVWFVWTAGILLGAWCLGALPAIALVRERWLLRHQRLAVVISGAAAEMVVLVKFQFWRWFERQYHFNGWLLTLYSLLLSVFAATTAAVYLRLVVGAGGKEVDRKRGALRSS